MEAKRQNTSDWELRQQEEDTKTTADIEREKFQQEEDKKETERIEREKQEQVRR